MTVLARVAHRLDERRLLIAVVLVGAGWRIAVLVSKWGVPLKLNDSYFYSWQAAANAQGDWFADVFAVPGAEHPPLTSLVLTPAGLLDRVEFWQRATMTVIGIAALVMIAVAARAIAGARVAVVAAAIAALYPNIWMSDALIMAESLAMLLVALTLWLGSRCLADGRRRWLVACGVAIGFAALARSELLMLAPLAALAIGIGRDRTTAWRRGVVVILAAAVTVAPWIVANAVRYEAVLMSTNEGGVLRGANCPASYGGEEIGGWSLSCLTNDAGPPGEDAVQRSIRWRRAAIEFALAHPKRAPLVVAARVGRALSVYRLSSLVDGDVGEERPRWAVWAGIGAWWALAPLAVVGWRRLGPGGVRRLLAGPVVVVAVTTLLGYGSQRLRAPMEPVVVILAAVAVTRLRAVSGAIDRVVASMPGSRPDAAIR